MIEFINEWWPLAVSLLQVPLACGWTFAFVAAFGRPGRDVRWLLMWGGVAILCAAVATVLVPSTFGDDLLGFRTSIAVGTVGTAGATIELWARRYPGMPLPGAILACVSATLLAIVPFLLLLLAFAMNPD